MQVALMMKPDKGADYLSLDRRHVANLLDALGVIHCLPNLNDADARIGDNVGVADWAVWSAFQFGLAK